VPRIEEAQNLLAQQQPVVLTNPFPQGKNMTQASSSTNMPGGNQGATTHDSNPGAANVYMMRVDAHLQTRAHDYGTPKSVDKGKGAPEPSTPLHIEKLIGDTMTHIPKGAFKKGLITQMHGLPRTTLLLKIWRKPLAQCLLWRFSRVSPHKEKFVVSFRCLRAY
jgi:hypothetical protein